MPAPHPEKPVASSQSPVADAKALASAIGLDENTVALHQIYHDLTVEYTANNFDWVKRKGYVLDESLSPSEASRLAAEARRRLLEPGRWPQLTEQDMHAVSFREGSQRFCAAADGAVVLGDPCEHVFVVSLARRPSRLRHTLGQLEAAGLNATIVDAVDGDAILCQRDLAQHGVQVLPGYVGHRNHNIPFTTGEAGCFMSHYSVWHHMVERELPAALVLEDDCDLQADFAARVGACLEEASTEAWNILYLGSSPMGPDLRSTSAHVAEPGYTLWTIGYILRLGGARGLLEERVHERMAPLDDFFSVAAGRGADGHYNNRAAEWRPHVPVALRALAARPPLVMPYVGSYFLSDTALLREGRTRLVKDLPQEAPSSAGSNG